MPAHRTRPLDGQASLFDAPTQPPAPPRIRIPKIGLVRLPVRDVCWLQDLPRFTEPRFGEKGYRRGHAPANKGIVWRKELLTEDEIRRILDQCTTRRYDQRSPDFGIRDRALIALMWRSGLRVSCEALRLELEDLDPDRGTLEVRCGKGGKARTAAMDPYGWQELQPWLERRVLLPPGPLFCTIQKPVSGGPLNATHLRTRLRKIARDLGIRKHVHPHLFRTQLACDLVREDIDMVTIQHSLGHSSLAVTSIYLSALGEERIQIINSRPAPGFAS